ncbi:FANCD2 opposite strand protein [Pseudophryne corroboree]|uniref:FANCD2 opposite strand protein n=1 Tax=Pseudophryne corroboree TaxID=495146 RepID=UPI003081E19F
MATYQLWSPWTPLDESLQWIRRAAPRTLSSGSSYMQVLSVLPGQIYTESGSIADLPHYRTRKSAREITAPTPVLLRGVDQVFCTTITVQPPKWSGAFHVSENSAFSRVLSKQELQPPGLREPDVRVAVRVCKQLLHAILLLYVTYKKCTFGLQHAHPADP